MRIVLEIKVNDEEDSWKQLALQNYQIENILDYLGNCASCIPVLILSKKNINDNQVLRYKQFYSNIYFYRKISEVFMFFNMTPIDQIKKYSEEIIQNNLLAALTGNQTYLQQEQTLNDKTTSHQQGSTILQEEYIKNSRSQENDHIKDSLKIPKLLKSQQNPNRNSGQFNAKHFLSVNQMFGSQNKFMQMIQSNTNSHFLSQIQNLQNNSQQSNNINDISL